MYQKAKGRGERHSDLDDPPRCWGSWPRQWPSALTDGWSHSLQPLEAHVHKYTFLVPTKSTRMNRMTTIASFANRSPCVIPKKKWARDDGSDYAVESNIRILINQHGDRQMFPGLFPSVNDENRRKTMKITNVRAITLKGDKDRNFVRIETDEGVMGLGEAHPGAGNHRCDCATAQAFAHRYRSFFYVI